MDNPMIKYREIRDWRLAVKEDWKKSWEDSNIRTQPELFLIHAANYILITFLVYTLLRIMGEHIDGIKKNLNWIFTGIIFLWGTLLNFLKIQNFPVAERFKFSEIRSFDLKPSYTLYVRLLILNLIVLAIIKLFPFLTNRKSIQIKDK